MTISDRFRRAHRKITRILRDPYSRRDFLFGLSAAGVAGGLSWMGAWMVDTAAEARRRYLERDREMDDEDRRMMRRVKKYLHDEVP